MADAQDPEQLARRYLDLWQRQMAAQANDPLVAEAMAQAYVLMTRSAALLGAVAGLPLTSAATRTHDPQVDHTDASRAAAAGAPSDDPSLDPVRIARRLALLEERMLRLEAALAGDGRGAETPAGRRRRDGL
jgi:hypothetical protein